jgi:hypothetical protein
MDGAYGMQGERRNSQKKLFRKPKWRSLLEIPVHIGRRMLGIILTKCYWGGGGGETGFKSLMTGLFNAGIDIQVP